MKTLSLPLYSPEDRPLFEGGMPPGPEVDSERGPRVPPAAAGEISGLPPTILEEDSNNLPMADLEFPLLSSFNLSNAAAVEAVEVAPPMRLAMASAAAAAASGEPPLLVVCCCTMFLRNSLYMEAVSMPPGVAVEAIPLGEEVLTAGAASAEASVVAALAALLLFSLPDELLEAGGGLAAVFGIKRGSLGGTGEGNAPPREAIEAAKGFMKGAAPDMVASWLIHCWRMAACSNGFISQALSAEAAAAEAELAAPAAAATGEDPGKDPNGGCK